MNTTINELPRGINFVDSYKFKGYLARVYYPAGRVATKGFSISRYPNDAAALNAALAWRKTQIRIDPPPPKTPHLQILCSTNTSGHNGLSFTHVTERNGKRIEVINVSYSLEPNKPRGKKFRLHLYDTPEDALAEALAFRKEMEAEAIRIRKQKSLWPYDKE